MLKHCRPDILARGHLRPITPVHSNNIWGRLSSVHNVQFWHILPVSVITDCQTKYYTTFIIKLVWIMLNVICQSPKGQERVKFKYLILFGYFLKNDLITFLFIFFIHLLWDDIDQLSRDGFDWINWKVSLKAFQGRKSQAWSIFP